MKKLLYISLSAVLVGMIAADVTGQFAGQRAFMENGAFHVISLVAMIGMLVALWTLKQPRPTSARLALGVLSVSLGVAVFQQMLTYHMGILDGLVAVILAVVVAVEALEPDSKPVLTSPGISRS